MMGNQFFLDNEIIATLRAIELNDGGELESNTFILSSAKYNEYAIKIIKCVHENTKIRKSEYKI